MKEIRKNEANLIARSGKGAVSRRKLNEFIIKISDLPCWNYHQICKTYFLDLLISNIFCTSKADKPRRSGSSCCKNTERFAFKEKWQSVKPDIKA